MSANRVSANRRRPLRIESLESRAMLASNVTATVTDGTLNIVGDALANAVQISGGKSTSVNGVWQGVSLRISQAQTSRGVPTTINGQDFVNVTGVKNVTVHLGAGDDLLRVSNPTGPTTTVNLPGNVVLDGDDGGDIFRLFVVNHTSVIASSSSSVLISGSTFSRLSVNTETASGVTAQVDLVNVQAKGEVNLRGGQGNDRFNILGQSVFAGLLQVSMGSGSNSFGTGAGSNVEQIPVLNGPVKVIGGGQQDIVYIGRGKVNGTFNASLGAGDDFLTFFESTNNVTVFLGEGNDVANLKGPFSTGNIDGGIGSDDAHRSTTGQGSLTISNFEHVDNDLSL